MLVGPHSKPEVEAYASDRLRRESINWPSSRRLQINFTSIHTRKENPFCQDDWMAAASLRR
jgi:hypothetical protein